MGPDTDVSTGRSSQGQPSRPNGTTEPEDFGTTPANVVTKRVPYEELEAAIGVAEDGIFIEPAEDRYPCRRPKKKGEFLQVHPDLGLWQQAYVLIDELGMDRTVYLVAPAMRAMLADYLTPTLLVPAVNQDGEFFIWPIPTGDIALGRRTTVRETSARNAAHKAIGTWRNIFYKDGSFVAIPARGDLGEPEWPKDLTIKTINLRTFQDFLINSAGHEIAKVYMGMARR